MSERRTLRVESVPASTLVKLAWNGGGELPEALKGFYTSHKEATKAIDAWVAQNDRPEAAPEAAKPAPKTK